MNWKKKIHKVVCIGTAMVCLCMAMSMAGCSSSRADSEYANEQIDIDGDKDIKSSVLEQIPQEYILSSEEYDFYKDIYNKESKDPISDEELKEFISRYRAEFYLAKCLGVRADDSYEGLKEEWEKENVSRQKMKQKGEVFYGPVEYEFTDYFEYIYSNLILRNIDVLVENADEQLIADGKAYYEEHSKEYDDLTGVTCFLSDGERSEEKVFTYDEIQSLQKTNEAVLNFIMDAEIGESMEYMNGDKTVTLQLVSKEVDHREFEEMQGVIMKDYVQREYYDTFIDEIAEHLNISFDKE